VPGAVRHEEPPMKRIADKQAVRIADDGEASWPDLPPINTLRWNAGRKAQVVAAVEAGMLSVAQACRRYGLSPEEFQEWQRRYDAPDRPRDWH
jgi:hypothetical protein